MFEIHYAEGVAEDLAGLRATDRARILDRIEEQLTHQPKEPTRNKKILIGLSPTWEHEPPIWQLRVGKFRVFYDVNEEDRSVAVRAIREKPSDKTTEEIL